MIICGMEKYSMVDFPDKICCTVFTLSCNFRCPFCHNAGLVIPGVQNVVISEEEVFAYLSKRKKMIDAVCITGGEPTLQKDLKEFIKRVRETGLLVKLDSNGTRPEVLEDLLSENLIDYIAMDIKNAPSAYAEITGVPSLDIAPVKRSVEIIKNSGIDYEFRTTLVDGFHDEEKMEEIGLWLKGAERYVLQCFEDKGSNIKEGLKGIDAERAEIFLGIVKKYVPNAGLRNYN